MHKSPFVVGMFASFLIHAAAVAQQTGAVASTTNRGWQYLVLGQPHSPRGLLVLVPGYGDEITEFGNANKPPLLTRRLAAAAVATVVMSPPVSTLFFDSSSVRAFAEALGEVELRLGLQELPVIIGGFSAGGTGAIQLVEQCARDNCPHRRRVVGVFAVDAPLDFQRLWNANRLTMQRAAPESNREEAELFVNEIRRVLGSAPDSLPQAYVDRSPLAAFAPNGGNARFLRDVPLRAYTEPDVLWWMKNRAVDYYGMNSVDAAALVNWLRVAGNTQAELIITTGRGYRSNGQRHPHSWSIVDQGDLATWIASLVSGVGTRSK